MIKYITELKRVFISNNKRHTVLLCIKVTTIHYCRKIERPDDLNKTVPVFSDSQLALKAINSASVNFKLVCDCISVLNRMGTRRKLTLTWVPKHTGVKEHEAADNPSRQGSSRLFNRA